MGDESTGRGILLPLKGEGDEDDLGCEPVGELTRLFGRGILLPFVGVVVVLSLALLARLSDCALCGVCVP